MPCCRAAYRFFEGLPDSTLRRAETDALSGKMQTRWAVNAESESFRPGERRPDARGRRATAMAHIADEIEDLSEPQPNLRSLDDSDDEDGFLPTRHMDKCQLLCKPCKGAFTTSKKKSTTAEGPQDADADADASAEVKPCDGVCRYCVYRRACNADGVSPLQPSAFRDLYCGVMLERRCFWRRNKGAMAAGRIVWRGCGREGELHGRGPR